MPEGASTRPLQAKLIVDVGEPGGRTVERTLVLPVRAKGVTVGVKRDFDASLSAGDVATFEAIAVAPDGARIARKGAAWSLYQVTNDYQWFNADGRWSYEPVKSSKRIASGTIDIGADAPAKFSGRVGWGAHRLDIKTLDGEETSVAFDVGWSGTAGADTPDNVVVTLDKTNYAARRRGQAAHRLRLRRQGDDRAGRRQDRALHRRRSCLRRQCRSVRGRRPIGAPAPMPSR